MIIEKIINALVKLENANSNQINSHIRTILGIKSVRSSLPWNEGSRTSYLLGAHEPFGITSLYASQSLNLLTAHINSTEFDEDIAILNKELKTKIYTRIEKPIPKGWRVVNHNNYVKKGELIARGPNELDEIRSNISGKLKISLNKIVIESTTPIGAGTKIQNLFLQKHVLKKEVDRFKFVSIDKYPVKKETLHNLEAADLRPKTIDMTKLGVEKPTIVTGSNSIFKRRASGHLAQLWLGLTKAFPQLTNKKSTLEHHWDKTVFVTKVLDTKHNKTFDAIIGIPCWLISITSGGFEYNIATKETDFIGRHKNSVSIDPFSYKTLKYYNEDLAEAILEYQIEKRKEALKTYLEQFE